MEFISAELDEYVKEHTSPESSVLAELDRETYSKVLMPRMLSGHIQGRILSMMSHMIRPKQILEIGTFTGYSAICMAEGLPENGLLHTIDINEELTEMVLKYFDKAGLSDKIKTYVGNALDIIPGMKEVFDLVFIDADKINYMNYYNLVFDKVSKGGFIIADNVLWSGKVLEDYSKTDADTKAIMDFNKWVQEDERVENVLLPVRDGLLVMRKK